MAWEPLLKSLQWGGPIHNLLLQIQYNREKATGAIINAIRFPFEPKCPLRNYQ
jgi:hypothetical protein